MLATELLFILGHNVKTCYNIVTRDPGNVVHLTGVLKIFRSNTFTLLFFYRLKNTTRTRIKVEMFFSSEKHGEVRMTSELKVLCTHQCLLGCRHAWCAQENVSAILFHVKIKIILTTITATF